VTDHDIDAVQQQVEEMRAYRAALAEREHELGLTVAALQQVWSTCYGEPSTWVPAAVFLREMIHNYPLEAVEEAIRITAPRESNGYFRHMDGWHHYLRSVARNLASEPTDHTRQWRAGWGVKTA